MLIAVSVKKPDLSAELADAFGRSEYFLLLDSTKNASEFVQNPYSSELGRAGIQSARFLIERKVETVITTFIGFNTLRFFNSLNIKIYKCEDCNAQDSLKLFAQGSLEEINENMIEIYPQRRRKRFGREFINNNVQNNNRMKYE
ncbi:MAG TPA: NifB/NifX family molybdenum-iron cluster-binding protein [Ignavibacteriaceae bacterium]|nr:NifB/NifX family molybdenum-iron cluster-binding protein [Ignavibacteriaceae bacterium]